MIKARNYLFLAAAATLLLAGCQNGLEEGSKGSSNVVTIRCNAGSPSSSRIASYSTDSDQMRYFEVGDQVCVSTDGQEAVVYQCTNADQQTWAEADSSKFLLWTDDEMTFKAYYPVTTGTSMTSFTLPADQSTTEKIAQADYMTRQQTCANVSGTDIYLYLERKMARVIVNIAGFTDQYDNDEKTVSNVRIYSQYSTINDGNGNGDITAVTPYMQGTGGQGTSYTALVVPSDGDDGATFIQLTDGENNTLTVKGIPELEAGKSYTFNLTVGKNTIQVQSVTVTDWTGATLTGGQAQEASATITVTWNNDDITGSGKSFTKDGVTITAGMIDFNDKNFMDGGTFSTTLGNFTKIEVTAGYCGASGTGWSGSTWTGNASSVSFSGDISGMGMGNTKLVFTIEPTN